MWLALVALRPAPVPLARVLSEIEEPALMLPAGPGGSASSWAVRVVDRLGVRGRRRDQQLALAGVPAAIWARDKLLGATVGLAVPLLVWTTLAAVDVALPPVTLLVAGACAVGGFILPDLRLRDQVDARRRGFQYALSAYLDLVNIILAGGGGIETALGAAADAGDGWAFAELRRGLHTAQRINQPLWTAFDDLGARLDVPELRDLASSLGLAGSQGVRIRASLAVKADTLRARQIAQTEAAAEATTERMNIPTAVLLLGFLLFIVFPAVTAITGTTSPTQCLDGTNPAAVCTTEQDATQRSIP
jgi:Flp pilus assembly protein TadB